MHDNVKDDFIIKVKRKLCEGIRLNDFEIRCIISALMKERGVTQEPFYELIYHDEYDRQESRIMNPVYQELLERDGYCLQRDVFELNFQRIIKK